METVAMHDNAHKHPSDPYVWLAQEMLIGAVENLRKHWRPERPIWNQDREFRRNISFLCNGTALAEDPMVFHELFNLSCDTHHIDWEALLIQHIPGMESQDTSVNKESAKLTYPIHD